mgnify:CR=1 FL=1
MKPKIKERIEKLNSLREAYRSELVNTFQSTLQYAAQEIFEADPGVKGISWVQYTPYFNDGDPCTFGVGTPNLCFSWDDAEANNAVLSIKSKFNHESENFAVCYISRSSLARLATLEQQARFRKLVDLRDEFNTVFETYQDAAAEVFGDGYRVTITPAGGGFIVQEHSHD